MTKTVLTILVTLYSLARLVAIGSLYYLQVMRLPLPVLIVTGICCVCSLLAAYNCYMRHKTGKLLRLALFICAATAAFNMIVTLLEQPGNLTNAELLITGTIFDLLLFAGSCTIKIRDNRGNQMRNPFTRMARTDHPDYS